MKIEISTGTILKIVLIGIFLWILWILRWLAMDVLASVVIASAIEPFTKWFMKYRTPRTLAVIIIYILIFVTFSAAFYLVLPALLGDFSTITTTLPQSLRSLDFLKNFSSIGSQIAEQIPVISNLSSGFINIGSSIFGGVFSLILIVVLSFYFAVQRDGIEVFLRVVTPTRHEEYIIDLWGRARHKIGRWLQGQLFLGFLIGVLVYLGLTILQVPYALTFAFIAAVFEIIPYFGPILSAVAPLVVGFNQSPKLGFMVLGLFIIIHQFENHLIYPLVIRKIVGVHPIVIILSLIIGVELAGFLGILLSIPVAAALMEFVDDIDRKKHGGK